MANIKSRLLTFKMVAERFGVPIGTVYSMKSRGQLPFVQLGRRLIRFDEEAIEKWLDARTVSQGCSPVAVDGSTQKSND